MTATPFKTFGDLFAADPYELAAAAVDLFHAPKISQGTVQTWLRGLVAEKGATFLGLNVSEPPPLEAVEFRVILILERSLVAARVTEGSDHRRDYLLLLDPQVRSWPYPQRLAYLQGHSAQQPLR